MNRAYWFKRRRYGWGWTPVTWQGWIVVLGYLVVVVGGGAVVEGSLDNQSSSQLSWYLAAVGVATVLLMILSFAFGPTPKWRWGVSAEDNPDEDY